MTYDCFMFFNELDLLEARFNILDPYVDYFVLGESGETFSGKPKPLYFWENKERFAKWLPKIIHVMPPISQSDNSFQRAFEQKEFLKTGLKDAKDDDIVYYGDLDEIWKPQTITDDKVYNIQQLNYCYYLNNRSSEEWVGTIVGRYGTIKCGLLRDFRANHENILDNGGWHFTNCMGYDNIIKKLESYDHQEYNTSEVKEQLKERMENGEDYVGRAFDWRGRPFEFWRDESDLPEYLIKHKDEYKHLFR